MSVEEEVMTALKEVLMPELSLLRQEFARTNLPSSLPHDRLDDMIIHLMDHSRRIDALRRELSGRIDPVHSRIDAVHSRLSDHIDSVSSRIDKTIIMFCDMHQQLITRINRLEQEVVELKKQAGA